MALVVEDDLAAEDGGSPTTPSITVTIPATTAGSLLVVAGIMFDTSPVPNWSSVVSGANNWTQFPGAAIQTTAGPLNGCALDVWYLPNCPGGLTQFVATSDVAQTQYKMMMYWEVSGWVGTPVPDVVQRAVNQTSGSTTVDGQAVTTTGTSGFIVGLCIHSVGITQSPKAGDDFTSGGNIISTDGSCSLITTATGTYTPTWLASGAGTHSTLTAAFKDNGVGGDAPFAGSTTVVAVRRRVRVDLDASNLLQSTLAPAPAVAPFTNAPNPVPRAARRLTASFAEFYTVDDSLPTPTAPWTMPARKARAVRFEAPNLLASTLAPAVGAPFVAAGSAIVLPRVRRVVFESPNLLTTTLAPAVGNPFVGSATSLLRPRERRASFDTLNLTLITPPGPFPFITTDWGRIYTRPRRVSPVDQANLLLALYQPVIPPFVQSTGPNIRVRARVTAPTMTDNLLETTLAPPATFLPAWAVNRNTGLGGIL